MQQSEWHYWTLQINNYHLILSITFQLTRHTNKSEERKKEIEREIRKKLSLYREIWEFIGFIGLSRWRFPLLLSSSKYNQIEPTSRSKNTANGFNVKKSINIVFWNDQRVQYWNNQFFNVILRGTLHLVWLEWIDGPGKHDFILASSIQLLFQDFFQWLKILLYLTRTKIKRNAFLKQS